MGEQIGVILLAAALGAGHVVLLAALTRRLLLPSPARAAGPAGLLGPLLPRLALAALALLALWQGGHAAGLGALAGYWLGRTLTCAAVAAGWRFNPG